MRNLKRVLSLALAAMMLIGMMVVGASAANLDFTDSDEIKNTEAVEVMVALNVFNGVEDGSSFDPAGTLTREQMSKIIAYVMNGGVEPVLGVKDVPTYSDIDDNWAEKYIEYCTSMGIIAGDGTGKFNPKDPLTGEQAAKMLLTAMGYNANVFGFTGDSWSTNVNRYANEAGLYKDLGGLDPSAPISRDDACQLAYNALQATMMERTWQQDMETGKLTETYRPWTTTVTIGGTAVTFPVTLLREKFDGSIAYAYLTDFTYDEVKGLWTYQFGTGANFGGTAIPANKAYADGNLTSSKDYTALFGQQVKVIYNTEDPDVIYGIYASDSSVIATGASGELGTIDDTAHTIKVGGTAYRLGENSATIEVYNFGVNAQVSNLAALKANQLASAFTFKLVDNTGDSKIDAVIVTPVTVSQIIYVGTDTISFNNLNQRDKENVVIYDDYAKGDWVYFTAAANAPTCQDTFEKAELQTATVDGVKGSDVAAGYSDFQLNGTWYSETTNNSGIYSVATSEVNDTIEFVTLGSVMFYAKVTDVAATTKNVAMVISGENAAASGTSASVVKAKLLFADGTKSTQTIAKLNGEAATYHGNDDAYDVEDVIGALVTYRVNADGDYELSTVATNGNSSDNPTFNFAGYKGAANGTGIDHKRIGGYELADDAVVFVLTDGAKGTGNALGTNDGKVYTGKEIKNAYGAGTFGTYAQVLYGMENGFNYGKVAAVTGGGKPTITTGSNYGYITSGAYRTVENDKTYLNVTFWTQDGEVTAKFEDMAAPNSFPAGAIITYDVVSDTEIKNVTIVNAATGVVTGWDGSKKIHISGLGDSEVDPMDTVVIYVNSKDKVGAEGGFIQIGKDTDNDDVADVANVRYYGNTTVLDLLVVDVNNEMATAPAITLNGNQADDSEVTTALTSSDSVTVSGTLATDGLLLAQGKTLTVTGALTATGAITGNGTLVVNDVADAATAGNIKVKTVQISAAISVAELKAVAANQVAGVAVITLGTATTGNAATADNFYATNGTAVNNAPVPAGTYTYYGANSITNAEGEPVIHNAGWFTADAVAAIRNG